MDIDIVLDQFVLFVLGFGWWRFLCCEYPSSDQCFLQWNITKVSLRPQSNSSLAQRLFGPVFSQQVSKNWLEKTFFHWQNVIGEIKMCLCLDWVTFTGFGCTFFIFKLSYLYIYNIPSNFHLERPQNAI